MNAFLPASRLPRFALVTLVLLAAFWASIPALTRPSRRSGPAFQEIPPSTGSTGETGYVPLIRLPLTVMNQLLLGARP